MPDKNILFLLRILVVILYFIVLFFTKDVFTAILVIAITIDNVIYNAEKK
jgi:hypothetical protein